MLAGELQKVRGGLGRASAAKGLLDTFPRETARRRNPPRFGFHLGEL